jgi:hypothetical protein
MDESHPGPDGKTAIGGSTDKNQDQPQHIEHV